MDSFRQSLLIPIALTIAIASPVPAADNTTLPVTQSAKKKFLDDDPLWVEPKARPLKGAKAIEIDNVYDFIDGSFVVPRRAAKLQKQHEVLPAANVNTLGEVPDSEWYTNRRGLSLEQIVAGAGNANPPEPNGQWHVISGKNDGVTPGLRIEDAHHNRYLLKFDPPDFPELASAADVIGSKIYHAAGYNTPENYVVYFTRDQLLLTGASTYRDAYQKKHTLTRELVDKWLSEQPKDDSGRYRAMASRLISGKPLGPFTLDGTRADDPNDIVPHQLRRELRGMGIIAAWLNDTDTRAANTLDSLVEEDGVTHIKHYRIDWGASLGSDSLQPKDIRRGHDYAVDNKPSMKETVTFGFYIPHWMNVKYRNIKGVGTFDSESFDAAHWKNNYPVLPFLLMDDADAYWAAKKVMAFTDAEIKAIVVTAQYSDPRATEWVAQCLIARRNKIGQEWLSRGLPLDNFRTEAGTLSYDDLANKYLGTAAKSYNVRWSAYDNTRDQNRPLSEAASGWQIPASQDEFLAATITGAAGKSVTAEVVVYLRAAAGNWTVVGIDRRNK